MNLSIFCGFQVYHKTKHFNGNMEFYLITQQIIINKHNKYCVSMAYLKNQVTYPVNTLIDKK